LQERVGNSGKRIVLASPHVSGVLFMFHSENHVAKGGELENRGCGGLDEDVFTFSPIYKSRRREISTPFIRCLFRLLYGIFFFKTQI